jgi:hypothetical protein
MIRSAAGPAPPCGNMSDTATSLDVDKQPAVKLETLRSAVLVV